MPSYIKHHAWYGSTLRTTHSASGQVQHGMDTFLPVLANCRSYHFRTWMCLQYNLQLCLCVAVSVHSWTPDLSLSAVTGRKKSLKMSRSIKGVSLSHWSDNKTACSTVDDPRIELAFAISSTEFSAKNSLHFQLFEHYENDNIWTSAYLSNLRSFRFV